MDATPVTIRAVRGRGRGEDLCRQWGAAVTKRLEAREPAGHSPVRSITSHGTFWLKAIHNPKTPVNRKAFFHHCTRLDPPHSGSAIVITAYGKLSVSALKRSLHIRCQRPQILHGGCLIPPDGMRSHRRSLQRPNGSSKSGSGSSRQRLMPSAGRMKSSGWTIPNAGETRRRCARKRRE